MSTRFLVHRWNSALAVIALVVSGAAHAGAPASPAESSWCAPRCDQLVIDWNHTAHQVFAAENGHADPLGASRTMAMMHLAMHDAVNAVQPRYAAYALRERAAGADAAVAAVTAAHDVLLALHPKQAVLLKAQWQSALQEAGKGAAVESGKSLGARAARAILERRAADGSNANESYTPGTRAGEYRYTPGFEFIALPHWRNLQPFGLRDPAQFRVAAPPALDSAAYARAFEEVKRLGGAEGAQRTADQSHFAAFWYEFSEIGWNRVARVVARQQPMDLAERARMFALVNVALADSYIAGWDSKMHYNAWRPVTAIRLAANDGNPATQPDLKWSSMLPTPPIQDHPSTHSALGAAAAEVLAQVLGRDDVAFAFTSTSADAANPARRFASFSDAARENADSRVMAGLHFRFATDAGLQLGRLVGAAAVAQILQPIASSAAAQPAIGDASRAATY